MIIIIIIIIIIIVIILIIAIMIKLINKKAFLWLVSSWFILMQRKNWIT